jgi:hypothetical protein
MTVDLLENGDLYGNERWDVPCARTKESVMSVIPRNEIERLAELRLPELQARYAEVVGETSRCPNKAWLIRRIVDALRAQPARKTAPRPMARKRTPLGASVSELQARHLEVIGRPTGSSHVGYLRWRLRQAERGRIRVGAAPSERLPVGPVDERVIPLRMATAVVSRLDEARRRLGLASRAELFRRALYRFLVDAGERDVAGLFVRGEATQAEAADVSPLRTARS